uniref:Uncharacterized protein n=1 Tax=Rhizophagus irregularis (strain DAOM 181602 / DAOM 197198 / MUCL 43194) TaxID=747089 RepID=U9T1T7_RHIID
MLQTNPAIKNRCDQKFIGILVKDQRPISIRDNIGFTEFIYEFDPNYQFPSEKRCKKLLAKGYNQTKKVLISKMEKEWKLDGKILTITMDNGSNMVLIAYMLQLVMGKELIPAEVLVARAKRLMLNYT